MRIYKACMGYSIWLVLHIYIYTCVCTRDDVLHPYATWGKCICSVLVILIMNYGLLCVCHGRTAGAGEHNPNLKP